MTFTATLPRQKLASTFGGMRRMLKYKGSVHDYIRKAVETGIYRSNEELEAVWRERRESADDLATIMRRFRQDIVRGSHVQDYPVEYLILRQHPPIPDPPRVPKRIAKRMQEAPHPTERLMEKYLTRQERKQRRREQTESGADASLGGPRTTEEYYRRLLGVPAPPPTSSLGQKPAVVQKAYAAAVKQYQLQRTEGMSEQDALEQVEELLKLQETQERGLSRQRAQEMRDLRSQTPHTSGQDSITEHDKRGVTAQSDGGAAGDSPDLGTQLQNIFNADRATLEGMMRWSDRLQAVPYAEWTVGASTALDHWIARRLLGLSEETWTALLEGDDPSLLSRGRDIVAVRESLFPETMLNQREENDSLSDGADFLSSAKKAEEESIEELLASLGRLKTTEPAAKPGDGAKVDDLDARVDKLVTELNGWRRMNQDKPYKEWEDEEKERFDQWMKEYINTVTSDAEKSQIDYKSTRESLLSQPAISAEDSEAFWGSLEDPERAVRLLESILSDGPPAGAAILHKAFWDLPYEEQLERLLNLGAIRPLMDEYTKESERRTFLQRYGDTLLNGVVMEHLVPDPDGPVRSSDVAGDFGLPKHTRFRLEMKAYRSGLDQSANEKTRAMYVAWNMHKTGRAQYEEKLFRTGRLGLRYSDQILKDDEFPLDEEED